jgi:hypothetical protein
MCDKYIQTTEKSSMGKEKDSCLKCGRTVEAHSSIYVKPEIHIYFGGKLRKFSNWEEARLHGFYLY